MEQTYGRNVTRRLLPTLLAVLDLDGQCAGKVLFESEGLSGYTPPGGEARQGAARGAEGSAGAAGERVSAAGFCRDHSANSRGIGYEKERAPTLGEYSFKKTYLGLKASIAKGVSG